MNLKPIFLIPAAIAALVVLPAFMLYSIIDHIRHKGSERKGGGSISAGVAGAMLDLDRFVRPSVEHHIEAEHQTGREKGVRSLFLAVCLRRNSLGSRDELVGVEAPTVLL